MQIALTNDRAHIRLIETGFLDAEWEKLTPYLLEAIDRVCSKDTIDDIYALVYTGTSQLWAVDDKAWMITRVDDDVLQLTWTLGRDLHEWMHDALMWAEEIGRFNRCKQIEAPGREGWKRLLKTYGYKLTYIMMVKEL